MAERVGGLYQHGEAKTLYEQLLAVSATVNIQESEVVVQLKKRAHNPLLKASRLADEPTPMPWFGGKRLRITFA